MYGEINLSSGLLTQGKLCVWSQRYGLICIRVTLCQTTKFIVAYWLLENCTTLFPTPPHTPLHTPPYTPPHTLPPTSLHSSPHSSQDTHSSTPQQPPHLVLFVPMLPFTPTVSSPLPTHSSPTPPLPIKPHSANIEFGAIF